MLQEVSLEADPLLIKELFSNLLNNAYDAITHTSGKIEIGTKECSGEVVSVYIKDNGIGMDPEILKKAPEPFGLKRL
jgi:signal transduction histidine kinase